MTSVQSMAHLMVTCKCLFGWEDLKYLPPTMWYYASVIGEINRQTSQEWDRVAWLWPILAAPHLKTPAVCRLYFYCELSVWHTVYQAVQDKLKAHFAYDIGWCEASGLMEWGILYGHRHPHVCNFWGNDSGQCWTSVAIRDTSLTSLKGHVSTDCLFAGHSLSTSERCYTHMHLVLSILLTG